MQNVNKLHDRITRAAVSHQQIQSSTWQETECHCDVSCP